MICNINFRWYVYIIFFRVALLPLLWLHEMSSETIILYLFIIYDLVTWALSDKIVWNLWSYQFCPQKPEMVKKLKLHFSCFSWIYILYNQTYGNYPEAWFIMGTKLHHMHQAHQNYFGISDLYKIKA